MINREHFLKITKRITGAEEHNDRTENFNKVPT